MKCRVSLTLFSTKLRGGKASLYYKIGEMGFYYSTTTNYLYFGISVNGRCTQKAIKKPTEVGF